MANSKSSTDQNYPAATEFPSELPPEITLLLPDQEQRDVATLTYRLFSDANFRTDFFADPAGALVRRGLSADAKLIDTLHRMDKEVLEKMVQDYKAIFARSGALKWEPGPEPRTLSAVLFAAAYFAGTVSAHYIAHRILHHERSGRDI